MPSLEEWIDAIGIVVIVLTFLLVAAGTDFTMTAAAAILTLYILLIWFMIFREA